MHKKLSSDDTQKLCKVKQLETFKVASLFAGVGGIDLAFQNAGFKIEWANEIDKKACETYSKNFKHKMICDDIKNLKTDDLSKSDKAICQSRNHAMLSTHSTNCTKWRYLSYGYA